MSSSPVTSKKVAYVRGLPLLGSQFDLKHDRLNFLQRLAQAGDVSSFHLGFSTYFLVNEPELAEKVLVQHSKSFDRGRRLRSSRLHNGIVTSANEVHRQQRKSLASMFQPRHVLHYADVVARYGEQRQQQWKDGEVIDLFPQMVSLTMDILGNVLFNAEAISKDGTLAAAVDGMFKASVAQLFTAFSPPKSWQTPRRKRLREAGERLAERVRTITAQFDGDNPAQERKDFLYLLIKARAEQGEAIDVAEIARECWPVFFAGYSTSPLALLWAWYLLMQHPEVYQKVQEEVDSVLGGRTPTYEDLANLPYCLQVFKETLRMCPPAPMIRREALHDLDIDGYQIPAGAIILISPYTMHRRADTFPEPERFDPERFTPEREKQLPRYAYMPFGGGPRVCLGNHFALMEGHLLLATLAQRLRFELVANHPEVGFDLEHNLALRPDRKIEVIVRKRKGQV
ncbi:cytochrome P450 [Thermosporothrix hazakensis]|jgi:cytochrome P450|uniref:Cytochrome P450 n=1 Tax=Thermosporothrix hazakensis TaxID=644383 RepID=A0A326U888_THEHA|nr:cytochrome P450 [Thermosporothrix hazakensis]PZW31911.1 cytochrome P450 [Thermosporothrix hazakensis]GCE49764.1 cytochrome P450 [Thermosporothrix hazakensis]